mmetsp:Transcript_900/g.2844  ORF Transcript_900/g.2844 Transcript_900/m.2844 type:complete len:201 (-) Transcript_900:251-853(-)
MRAGCGTTRSWATSSSESVCATASAAARKSSSGMVEARHMAAPKESPGKMYTLFTCPGECFLPSIVTGSNEVPVPKMARPCDHVYASCAVTSACVFGFERAKMIGRSAPVCAAAGTADASAAPSPGCAESAAGDQHLSHAGVLSRGVIIASITARSKQPGATPTAPTSTVGRVAAMMSTSASERKAGRPSTANWRCSRLR